MQTGARDFRVFHNYSELFWTKRHRRPQNALYCFSNIFKRVNLLYFSHSFFSQARQRLS
jgi:hypothetical protein